MRVRGVWWLAAPRVEAGWGRRMQRSVCVWEGGRACRRAGRGVKEFGSTGLCADGVMWMYWMCVDRCRRNRACAQDSEWTQG